MSTVETKPRESAEQPAAATPAAGRLRIWAFALGPVLLMAGLAWWVVTTGGQLTPRVAGPVEELTIQRVTFPDPETIVIRVQNTGPGEVTIGQVMIDEALMLDPTTITYRPSRTLPRLGTAEITVPMMWVSGDPMHVRLVTKSGLTFDHEVAAVYPTPRVSGAMLWAFALLGIYVGVVPIAVGLLWLPWVRRLRERWLDVLLAFTAGLLVFLGVDSLHEGLEAGERIPSFLDGTLLLVLGTAGSFLLLQAVGNHGRLRAKAAPADSAPFRLSFGISLGIGLHNLGEGLAIGAAYALGETVLMNFLILGFMLHNTTEGLAIIAPIANRRIPLARLAGYGLLAGAPTILGCWVGGFTYSDLWSVLFLGVGAGAIFQVVYEIAKLLARREPAGAINYANLAGLAAGFLVMLVTQILMPGA